MGGTIEGFKTNPPMVAIPVYSLVFGPLFLIWKESNV